MSCNCEPKKYTLSLGCCTPVLGPIEAYYTKFQIDKMLEEIESGITSGCCITPEEVDEKIDEAISGISPDLSDYYTKEEVDELIPEVPSLSGYATEQWVEDKHYITGVDLSDYATKEEIPSLSGYATEQWVLDKHYISGVDLSDYALKSEIPTVPTSNTAFTNDAGYLTEHQSLDGYATEAWVLNKHYITGVDLSDYVTYEDLPSLSGYATEQWVINQNYALNSELIQYITNLQNQIDSLKEQISGCCGSTGETITRWITMTGENDYTCSGTTKYTKEKEQQSTDGGNTWTDTGNYRSGSTVLEENSVDCGYIEPQYRWKAAPASDYMCSGTSKYYKVYYEVSYDNGQTWQHVVPEQTKRGNLIEANSTDCGYVPTAFKIKANYQIVGTTGTGQVNCDSSTTITKDEIKNNISSPSFLTSIQFGSCIDTIGEQALLKSSSLKGTVDIPSHIKTIGKQAFAMSDASAYTLHEGLVTIGIGAFSYNDITAITIPNSVKEISYMAFSYCTSLRSVTIGTGVTHIGHGAFEASKKDDVKITSMIINATTPPTLDSGEAGTTFYGYYTIYVPAASVNAYKTAWSGYASRIQAIP